MSQLVGEGLWAAASCSPLMIEMALTGPSSQLPDFTLWLQVQSPELGSPLGRVKMSIKANRRIWDPQGMRLTLLTQVSPWPPVSSASAPTALFNREIRDGEDSPTAAQVLRLTHNPRRKSMSEMACPDGPHAPCTLIQGTWSVV